MRYSEKLRIPGYLCTTRDTLSLPGITSLFQEAAWKHASLLGFAFTEEEVPVYWVLSRITIRVNRLPRWDDQVLVRTWPSGTHRLFATRELLIEQNDEVLVAGGSSWIILDSRTGRPVKPEKYLAGRLPVQEQVVDQDFQRLPPLEGSESTVTTPWTPVPPTALDRNLHVNNTRYLEWLVNGVHGTALEPSVTDPTGSTIVMTYTAETTLEDEYRLCANPELLRADIVTRPGISGTTPPDVGEKTAWSIIIYPSR